MPYEHLLKLNHKYYMIACSKTSPGVMIAEARVGIGLGGWDLCCELRDTPRSKRTYVAFEI